jgi:hypothetical protein
MFLVTRHTTEERPKRRNHRGKAMQFAHAMLVALSLALATAIGAGTAAAADDEGRIASIDRESLTITLENGNSYKLPAEVEVEALSEGMEILLAYDMIAGEKMVTDMELYD